MDQDITEIIKLPAYSDAHNMSTTATEPHDIVMSDDSMLLDADINTQTFHFFCRLPKEVRRRIWALNLPGPRIVVSIRCHFHLSIWVGLIPFY